MSTTARKSYPTDATDAEWAFVAPYPTLIREDAPQRRHDPREVYDALRWIVRAGAPWRLLPTNFPPWAAGHQQAQRWMAAGCFEEMVHDLRALLREAEGRAADPTAVVLDARTARTLRGTPESGHRAGYDGHERVRGSKLPAAVDTFGHLLALRVTPASAQERAQVGELADAVQEATGNTVALAWVDQGSTGADTAEAAEARGIELAVVRLPAAKRGFVPLPRRWVVERSFAWASRFRRLAKDDERLPETVAGLHVVAFACLMLHKLVLLPNGSPSHALASDAAILLGLPSTLPSIPDRRAWPR